MYSKSLCQIGTMYNIWNKSLEYFLLCHEKRLQHFNNQGQNSSLSCVKSIIFNHVLINFLGLNYLFPSHEKIKQKYNIGREQELFFSDLEIN